MRRRPAPPRASTPPDAATKTPTAQVERFALRQPSHRRVRLIDGQQPRRHAMQRRQVRDPLPQEGRHQRPQEGMQTLERLIAHEITGQATAAVVCSAKVAVLANGAIRKEVFTKTQTSALLSSVSPSFTTQPSRLAARYATMPPCASRMF